MPIRHPAALLSVAIFWAAGCGPSPGDAPGADWTGGAPGPAPLFDTPEGGVALRFVDAPAEAPDLTMETLDGRAISLADQRGKVVLVNFWATWCGPCREEIPYLVRLAERYPDHLTVIGVSEDHGPPATVAAFAGQYGVNYPIVMSTPEIKRGFPGVFALPTSFVVDPDGRIVARHVGLISPVILEQETRYLTALTHDATVETAPSSDQIRLANDALATEIPGVDLSVLTPDQQAEVLRRVNEEGCPCGCSLTLAQCRINDSSCGVSPPLVDALVAEVAGAE